MNFGTFEMLKSLIDVLCEKKTKNEKLLQKHFANSRVCFHLIDGVTSGETAVTINASATWCQVGTFTFNPRLH